MSYLTRAKVLAVFHAKGSHQKIGIELEVSPAHVGAIKRGRYHREITGARLCQTRREVVSPQKRQAIEAHPGTASEIAQELGVSVRTVNRYRRLRALKHDPLQDKTYKPEIKLPDGRVVVFFT